MPNIITITPEQVAKVAVSLAPSLLAPLASFASLVPLSHAPGGGRPTQIPVITAAPGVQANPLDFEENSDSTLAAALVEVAHLTVVTHVSNQDAQRGFGDAADWLAKSALESLAADMMGRALALLKPENFPRAAWQGPAGNFNLDALAACRSAVQSPQRCLLLSTACYSGVANHLQPVAGRWALPGFAAVHEVAGLPDGTLGAVLDPFAIGVAIGLPSSAAQPGEKAIDTGLGVQIKAMTWTSAGKRNQYLSFDALFGAAPANLDRAALILTGAATPPGE